MTHCPTERTIADYFTKPLSGKLFTVMRDIIIGITPYPSKECVENKVCTGMECKEIKSSTSNKESDQVGEKSTVASTTPGTD